MGFVRKVFLIVLAQLAVTAGLCAISITNEDYLRYQFNNWWVMLITFFIAIFVEIALLCSRNLARRVPINYILLFIFTASFSYAISYTCGVAGISCSYFYNQFG
jgi:protein lifeguard